ncbi:alpha/beta hydrolase [Chenggangzhangella methanolivorans]|uniref:Prolyl oligopeptidase family serine peptidase n=1 Tax=Chenggangzhangella methanolivorans TaxID=1437009 RepID=A0A9E6UM55_9HYPH|nr:alpha/beta hydrolase-fold protein [Chenggangzhangella methanolivorans]QZN98833.1 prolyl oligopeptidase family serine peptidase [Chenggangzhangella methanolivorans]
MTQDHPVVLSEAVRFDLPAKSGAAPYRIFLRTPPGDAPPEGWPVLYMLDGNAVFATAADAIRVQAAWPLGTGVREAAVVAIGYPTEAAYDSVRRSWDYSPPPGATYPPHVAGGPDVLTGGADEFLAFIEETLKPEISRRLPVNPARQAIFGHSFGGLFVLYALFNHPEAFATWTAASPTVYWENFTLLRSAERFEARADRPSGKRVLISVGEYEQTLAPFQVGAEDEEKRRAGHERSRTEENARAMSERLAAMDDLEVSYELIPCETHMTVLPTAINQAIRFAFGAWIR